MVLGGCRSFLLLVTTRWLPVGYPLEALMKALKALEKPLGNFSQALRKAVGKIRPTYSIVNLLIYGSD